jgi:hypothetical protein
MAQQSKGISKFVLALVQLSFAFRVGSLDVLAMLLHHLGFLQLLLLVTLAAVLLEAAPASNPCGSSSTSSISSGYVSFQRFRLTEGVWAHNLLEYRRWCAHFTIDDTFITQP